MQYISIGTYYIYLLNLIKYFLGVIRAMIMYNDGLPQVKRITYLIMSRFIIDYLKTSESLYKYFHACLVQTCVNTNAL